MVRRALEAADRNGRMGWIGFVTLLVPMLALCLIAIGVIVRFNNATMQQINAAAIHATNMAKEVSYPRHAGTALEVRINTCEDVIQRIEIKQDTLLETQVRVETQVAQILKAVK